jgi:DNA integrity scanning protein DisA with diadenylate cyclase activity
LVSRGGPAGRCRVEHGGAAVFDLARDKLGALLVLSQRDPLDTYLRGGLQVDALVSQELLRFQPPAPTHDGAKVEPHEAFYDIAFIRYCV